MLLQLQINIQRPETVRENKKGGNKNLKTLKKG